MSVRWQFVWRLAAGVSVFALASCAESAASEVDDSIGSPAPGESAEVRNEPPLEGVTDPLVGYDRAQMDSNYEVINGAHEALTDLCMAEAGFVEVNDSPPVDRSGVSRPAFELDQETARREGYGFNSGNENQSDGNPPQLPYSGAELDRYYTALFGPDNGELIRIDVGYGVTEVASTGCDAEARDAVYGEDFERFTVLRSQVEYAFVESMSSTISDSRFLDKEQRWSQCMSARGYHFATVQEAESAAAEMSAKNAIEQAVADATCRTESAFTETASRVLWAYEGRWIEQNPSVLPDYQAVAARVADRAAAAMQRRAAQ